MSQPQPAQAEPAARLTLAPDWEPVVTQLTAAGQDCARGAAGHRLSAGTATRQTLAHVAIWHHTGPYAGLQFQGFAVAAPIQADGRPDWTAARVSWPSRRYTASGSQGWTVRQLRPQEPHTAQAQATIAALDRAIIAKVRDVLTIRERADTFGPPAG